MPNGSYMIHFRFLNFGELWWLLSVPYFWVQKRKNQLFEENKRLVQFLAN